MFTDKRNTVKIVAEVRHLSEGMVMFRYVNVPAYTEAERAWFRGESTTPSGHPVKRTISGGRVSL